jgi:luciferase family oxidoreductase group 1
MRNTLDLARLTDRLGYTRYWLAEHHNTPTFASSAPEIMIGQVARETERIRVGSGGIMLPNHSPLKVAEWFRTLEALFPDRIDLGIGRAPGTDPRTALALRRSRAALSGDDFPEQLDALFSFTTGDWPPNHPFRTVMASPPNVPLPPVYLLGSSLYSAEHSAKLGLGFSFAAHFSPRDAVEAMNLYRDNFQPSEHMQKPHAILAVGAIVAETDERAQYLAKSLDLFWLRFLSGHPAPLPSPESALAYQYNAQERQVVASRNAEQFNGSPATVKAAIMDLVKRTRADEVMVTTYVYSHAERLRSYELLAEAFEI